MQRGQGCPLSFFDLFDDEKRPLDFPVRPLCRLDGAHANRSHAERQFRNEKKIGAGEDCRGQGGFSETGLCFDQVCVAKLCFSKVRIRQKRQILEANGPTRHRSPEHQTNDSDA
jgi:hypothetical protein